VSSSASPGPTSTVYAYLNQKCGVINGQIVRAYPGDGDKTKSGFCCSSSGFAGVTRDHCGTGCQAAYGRCGSSSTPLLNMGCNNQNDFALTFDDGPAIITDSLLDYLKSVSVKVTFFVNGISSLAQTDIPRIKIYDAISTAALKRAFADGHQICSHTWSHQSIMDVSEYNATYEMTRLNQAFKTIIGKIPTCMRPPYGNINDNSAKLLQGLGYGPDSNGGNAGIIMWNLDPAGTFLLMNDFYRRLESYNSWP
jgi:peptidoglycan/xylan/chitin deacetylase (PgdA/CDA1 family)